MKKMTWKKAAEYVEETYGTFVDWTEGFFICPECGEPIYKDDYESLDESNMCPVCECSLCDEEDDEDLFDEEEDDE